MSFIESEVSFIQSELTFKMVWYAFDVLGRGLTHGSVLCVVPVMVNLNHQLRATYKHLGRGSQ